MKADERDTQPHIGQFVKVLRGRDQGKFAVIVQLIDQKYVMIVDGDKRKFDQPKKKNLLHLELLDQISSEVVTSLKESGRVTNGKLRFVLSKFIGENEAALEKGE